MSKHIKLFFLFIFLCLTPGHVAWAACTDSSDCPSGHYCKTTESPPSSSCVACTVKPDNAEFTGHGTAGTTNQNDCPWDCDANSYIYDANCYPCPYGSTKASSTTCAWSRANTYFLDNNTSASGIQLLNISQSSSIKVSGSLLEKARNQSAQ